MLGVEIDPEHPAEELALGRQQQVEIVKALWRGSRVLVLDEPTSMLTPQAFAELEQVLTRLKERGHGIVFITHKLHEALSLGDRISILRHGRLAGALSVGMGKVIVIGVGGPRQGSQGRTSELGLRGLEPQTSRATVQNIAYSRNSRLPSAPRMGESVVSV